jgi:hypothetical protein
MSLEVGVFKMGEKKKKKKKNYSTPTQKKKKKKIAHRVRQKI